MSSFAYEPDIDGIQDFVSDYWIDLHEYAPHALAHFWRLVEEYIATREVVR